MAEAAGNANPMVLLACGPMMHGGSQWILGNGHVSGATVALYDQPSFSAEAILDLVRAGLRVGVTAVSHKVVDNLLCKVCEVAKEAGVPIVPVVSVGGHDTYLPLTDGRRLAKLLRRKSYIVCHSIDHFGVMFIPMLDWRVMVCG